MPLGRHRTLSLVLGTLSLVLDTLSLVLGRQRTLSLLLSESNRTWGEGNRSLWVDSYDLVGVTSSLSLLLSESNGTWGEGQTDFEGNILQFKFKINLKGIPCSSGLKLI
jgi:hypothetical protein